MKDLTRYITEEEWNEEGKSLFGPDKMKWKFKCPLCGHVASVQDWVDLKGERLIAFSCIGRLLPVCRKSIEGEGQGPCDYAGGGLFQFNPVHITTKDGKVLKHFEFAK